MITQTKPTRIMLIEEEPQAAELIMDFLQVETFDSIWHRDGNNVIENIRSASPDLVLLDAMLPGADGFAICKQIRNNSPVPIIILSNSSQESDRLLGFEMGADDYVCKPFSPRELIFRIKAILKRTAMPSSQLAMNPKLELEAATYKAKLNGRSLDLTPIEFRILAALSQSPSRVFTRNDLLDRAYPGHRTINDRTIDTHIKNLRKKLSVANSNGEIVHSIYGVGYKFEINS